MQHHNKRPNDPVEQIVFDALTTKGVDFSNDPRETSGLDFVIRSVVPIYIECKQFHAPRVVEQMAREKNVIVIQGTAAAILFGQLLR